MDNRSYAADMRLVDDSSWVAFPSLASGIGNEGRNCSSHCDKHDMISVSGVTAVDATLSHLIIPQVQVQGQGNQPHTHPSRSVSPDESPSEKARGKHPRRTSPDPNQQLEDLEEMEGLTIEEQFERIEEEFSKEMPSSPEGPNTLTELEVPLPWMSKRKHRHISSIKKAWPGSMRNGLKKRARALPSDVELSTSSSEAESDKAHMG
ncbi:hypothetical protein GLOTRDRAFT_93908 [Gloeophyllum trabeum ATCC 11539]|uniref:Uncharacterized protein n=1 Tax=Gloeophyllum trabeum (strain ATCC 11539 / FP-39264 / Madison 617) TaxID=670483 RepID=S7Q7P6_GLOTA|nr:uncharacterized protein GLOTRDRAFT_93908 [Gloeophyllum trabeum ATCC 11539]EPQ55478.1 hypothetical protein GLOTRDRAFT_93908 [Gloeophyllum trabeum ATCC 11539]